MSDDQDGANPIEQLLELMVYAPIGLIYEYQDVLPKLVKRGKSQVQLARVIGQFAAKSGQSDPAGTVGGLASLASNAVARALTDIGAQIGLAPTGPISQGGAAEAGDDPASPSTGEPDDDAEETKAVPSPSEPLPIAGYDELTAREIIPLLDDLSAAQRDRIRVHESGARNRKTVLAKLDRLQG